MTTANKVTLARIGLIPIFVVLAALYGESVTGGAPNPWLRWSAVLTFLAASISDGIDGYIARYYNQRSRLGAILDPLADKGLLVAGLLALTFSDWEYHLPIWFAALVISRDLVVVIGSLLLHFRNGHVQLRPRWTGKVATVFQMAALAWVMLQIHWLTPLVPVTLAALFTLASGIGYVFDGIRQLHRANLPASPAAEAGVGSPRPNRSVSAHESPSR
jgi:cardiolipin synthase